MIVQLMELQNRLLTIPFNYITATSIFQFPSLTSPSFSLTTTLLHCKPPPFNLVKLTKPQVRTDLKLGFFMDTKLLKFQILRGSILWRVFFRSIMLAATISTVALFRALSDFDLGNLVPIANNFNCFADSDNPSSNFFQNRFWVNMDREKDVNLTMNVVTELMGKQFLNCEANTLCVGEGSSMAVKEMKQLGFSTVSGVYTNRFFTLNMKRIVYELDYQDSSFDFVLSRDLDKVSVPAFLVLEVERVLKPNGIGALLVGATSSHHNDLIRSATPVSSLLRSSSVVHVDAIDDGLNLVVFKKRYENVTTFFQSPPT